MKKLALLILLAISSPAISSQLYDEYNISGWLENYYQKNRRIHYDVSINYKHNSKFFNSPEILSTKITIGNKKIEFPKEACTYIGPAWPSGIFATGQNEYRFYYRNCGDGAKSFAIFYIIKNGFLVARQLEADTYSELHDELMLFDEKGKVIYNGPCNRLGQPIRKVKAQQNAASNA